MQFQKDKGKNVLAFLNSRTKVNIINPAYAAQLSFKMQEINMDAQKIDKTLIET